ncbi:fumarylacetoacetate hydrolase family protein [Comamonas testosteroni]|jgi:acylpyruvate hydrolase|uniref:5-carboxymethyl-2-hydroxymuconate Delta-isomerase n=2 Tax=root TaxID=1 RepID=B7WQA2_COMTK|nr:fumarylacetoacetate hydrolase family protein [Comamonas testosteroni]EED65073.1 5-carboxymethyl-2-hydroxymuconate Delta-isomerase [Comamonas testosteroni KF-1]QDL89194.1 2,4-dihydroxy-5-methyl-6-oxo-2,4-hexadienoate (DMOH) isomerase [Sym plasmid]WQG68423.1 fumarylacetoacetate hydrolase family protein [Comamonas testosteroni]
MKLATFLFEGNRSAGALTDNGLAVFKVDGDIGDLLRKGTDLAGFEALLAKSSRFADPASVTFVQPSAEPRKILCVGLNYADHTAESPYEQPSYPTVFLRVATATIGHGMSIALPEVSEQLDYEGEMIAVIGKGGKRIPKERAHEHVFGYAVGNEVSIRDYQFKSPQWTIGKNFDGTGAWGPYIVTADELPRGGHGLKLEVRLNGKTVQSSNTEHMIFDVATIISTISEAMTLEAGDIIFTGTPAGVGLGHKPPLWMKDGDKVEVEIERIGLLQNTIAKETT